MSKLVIICEHKHACLISKAVNVFVHPRRTDDVIIFPVDLDEYQKIGAGKIKFDITALRYNNSSSEEPKFCASKEVYSKLSLSDLDDALDICIERVTVAALINTSTAGGTPKIKRLLNSCGISLIDATVATIGSWVHATITHEHITKWVNQFAMLGPYHDVANILLGNLRFISGPEIGDIFQSLELHQDANARLCVASDPRTAGKSGEYLSTLLRKRFQKNIGTSISEALQDSSSNSAILYEDGMWSATEVNGIVDSLLGKRPKGTEKIPPLSDRSLLHSKGITFAYAIGTNYGEFIFNRLLDQNGLSASKVRLGQSIDVCDLTRLESAALSVTDVSQIITHGPPPWRH
jgi:hypothetical protein